MIEIDKILKSQILECNTNYLLGVLSSNPSEYPNLGEDSHQAVTITKNGYNICFYVRPISSQPEPIIELDLYTKETGFSTLYIGFEESFRSSTKPLNVNYSTDIESKLKKIRERLENKVIIFRPKVSFTGEGKIFKNMDIISLEEFDVSSDTEYMPVPIVSDANKFEQSLKDSKLIVLKDFQHNMFQPDYVISDGYLYSFKDGWKKDPGKKNGWIYTTPKDIKKIRLNEYELKKHQVIANPDHLVFIDEGYLIGLHENFSKEGDSIINDRIEIEKHLSPALDLYKEKDEMNRNEEDEIIELQNLENKFLHDLQKKAVIKKLCYEQEDIVNFHISVKTNPITILSGMSGTGKSQLALIYAKTLGLSKQDGTLLVLPISPSYTEPEDLIGFHNSSSGLYVPAETGLVDLLIHAKNYRSQMHMVIFDEMNLSQVEHWFAPFISLLEIDENEKFRELKLWSRDSVCHNSSKYPSSIEIADNVIFIGTANVDETTKNFSDRLLDRANIVTPQKKKFASHRKSINEFVKEQEMVSADYEELYRMRSTYRSWNFNKDPWITFSDFELNFFDDLHELIQQFDKQKGVSFRALERMGLYLSNIPKDDLNVPKIERSKAIDLLVKQRILTKIRGSFEQFGDLIGTLSSIDGIPQDSYLYNYFTSDHAQEISSFSITLNEIKRKARELHINDYAS